MADINDIEAVAVIDGGKIDVRTVSPTSRAAKVNFLVVERLIMIFAWTTDDEIDELWMKHRGEAYVARIGISMALPQF